MKQFSESWAEWAGDMGIVRAEPLTEIRGLGPVTAAVATPVEPREHDRDDCINCWERECRGRYACASCANAPREW